MKTCVEGLVTKLCFQNSRKLLWCSIYSNCFRREFGSFPHSGFTKVSVIVLMWWFICFLSDSITETPQESSINDVNFPSNSWWPSAINKIETYYLILHCEKSRSNLLLLWTSPRLLIDLRIRESKIKANWRWSYSGRIMALVAFQTRVCLPSDSSDKGWLIFKVLLERCIWDYRRSGKKSRF